MARDRRLAEPFDSDSDPDTDPERKEGGVNQGRGTRWTGQLPIRRSGAPAAFCPELVEGACLLTANIAANRRMICGNCLPFAPQTNIIPAVR